MSKVQEFIDLVGQGQNSQAQEALNDILSAKAFEALEAMKQNVGANLFATEEVVEEEAEQLDEISFPTANAAYQKRLQRGHTATKDGEDDKNFEKAYDTKERVKKKFGSSGVKELEKRELPYDAYSK